MRKSSGGQPTPESIGAGGILAAAAVQLAISLSVRGRRRSARLLLASLLVSTSGELAAILGTRQIRHHSRPQVLELPVAIPLGWYAFLAPSYGLAQAALGRHGPVVTAAASALLATATDLANDPFGLDSGYWEWRDGGPYMPDVVGTNGAAGIPIANYEGWMLIAGGAALLAEVGRPFDEARSARRHRHILLLSYYLSALQGLAWASKTRRWGLLSTSALAVLGGGTAAWWAAGTKS